MPKSGGAAGSKKSGKSSKSGKSGKDGKKVGAVYASDFVTLKVPRKCAQDFLLALNQALGGDV
jgi:hypothetical protein